MDSPNFFWESIRSLQSMRLGRTNLDDGFCTWQPAHRTEMHDFLSVWLPRDFERLRIGYQEQRSEWFKAFAPFSNGDAQQLGLLGR